MLSLLIVLPLYDLSLQASQTPTHAQPDPFSPALDQPNSTVRWLLSTLRDPATDPSRRLAAARLLLESDLPGAQAQLHLDLATWPDPLVRQAILQALSLSNQPPLSFAPLLLEMLRTDPQPPLELSQALGRYADQAVLAHLTDLALDTSANLPARIGAVRALAWHRSPTVASLLIQLIEPTQSQPLRQAAFEALSWLTGIGDLGQDAAAWQRWWQQNRDLPPQVWDRRILDNLERSRNTAETYAQHLQQRLTETSRQLYRALPPEQQIELLVSLLNDPLENLRQLGLELSAEQLAGAPTAGLPPGVVRALIARLDDPAPALRRRAALLLRDAGSEEAANRAAEILQSSQESRPELVQAYLLLLTRLPKAGAVQPALDFLANPMLASEAADFLRVADENGLLLPLQRQEALVILRQVLEDPQRLTPAYIGLLGRLGREEDWRRIKAWLWHTDPVIRKAAAQTWAKSDQPLVVLMEVAKDPAITPIVLDAAVRRGAEPLLLAGLTQMEVDGEPLVDMWRRAMVAVAGRAPVEAVLQGQEILAQRGQQVQIRLQLIAAALEGFLPANQPGQEQVSLKLQGQEASDVVELLLARAGLYVEIGEAAAVLIDCNRIDELGLPTNSDQRQRQILLMVQAAGRLGEDQVILKAVQSWLNIPSPERRGERLEQLARILADRVQQHIQAKEEPKARELVSLAAKLPLEGLPGTLAEHIRQLEAQLNPPPPVEPAQSPESTETDQNHLRNKGGAGPQTVNGNAGRTGKNQTAVSESKPESATGVTEQAKN